jgi:hypothetical protein
MSINQPALVSTDGRDWSAYNDIDNAFTRLYRLYRCKLYSLLAALMQRFGYYR